jgi:hypothetical protein
MLMGAVFAQRKAKTGHNLMLGDTFLSYNYRSLFPLLPWAPFLPRKRAKKKRALTIIIGKKEAPALR